MTSTQAWQRRLTAGEKLHYVKNWLHSQKKRQREGRRAVVTADEVIEYIKKRWPTTPARDIDDIYQATH